jgi:hypothetical protein
MISPSSTDVSIVNPSWPGDIWAQAIIEMVKLRAEFKNRAMIARNRRNGDSIG